jgi:Family of unknown function (DUF5995)
MPPARRTTHKSRLDVDLSPVDEVIRHIDEIIDWSIKNNSPIGYFAALYKRTNKAIRGAIAAGRFADGPRMVRIDAKFAARFFDAVEAHRDHKPPTRVWELAFEDHDGAKALIILQYVMTALNAHINLDLGVVAATELNDESEESLHHDFVAINTILASQIPGVLKALDEISPAFERNRKLLRNKDSDFVEAGLNRFRDTAWMFACELAAEPKGDWADTIAKRDAVSGMLGRWYLHPTPFGMVIDAIRKEESQDVAHNIEVLAGVAQKPAALPRTLW